MSTFDSFLDLLLKCKNYAGYVSYKISTDYPYLRKAPTATFFLNAKCVNHANLESNVNPNIKM